VAENEVAKSTRNLIYIHTTTNTGKKKLPVVKMGVTE
jgi:hypothetical protein